MFQSELIISESNFLRAFPSQQGYRFFLLKGPANAVERFAAAAEDALADAGLDASLTADRLAEFHRVENTYISTLQILGGLGLLIGTLGLAVVLMRNVLERRRELALLWAVGYNPSDIAWIVLAENVLLLAAGVAAGTLCAALAVAPALASHGRQTGIGSLLLLPSLVILTGVIASAAATRAAIRAPLLESLRAE
jgi:ABC-type antimicrobial peptide transport system permease subunit